jgi:hypothetical protein
MLPPRCTHGVWCMEGNVFCKPHVSSKGVQVARALVAGPDSNRMLQPLWTATSARTSRALWKRPPSRQQTRSQELRGSSAGARRVELWDDALVLPPALAAPLVLPPALAARAGDELLELKPRDRKRCAAGGRDLAAAPCCRAPRPGQELQAAGDAANLPRPELVLERLDSDGPSGQTEHAAAPGRLLLYCCVGCCCVGQRWAKPAAAIDSIEE